MPSPKVTEYDFGVVVTEIRSLATRFDEFRKDHREHIDRIYKRFEDLPDRYVRRMEFDDLKKDVDGMGVLVHQAEAVAEKAVMDNAISAAGIAPWRAILYMTLTAIAGAAATAVFR